MQTQQRLACRYGPLVVTPGSNLILLGPVTIESPRANGFITRFEPNLVDALSGEVPPIHQVHLHHGVWLNPTKHGSPFFATGEEKTVSQLPAGYGYRTSPSDAWILNYMLHNLTSQTYEVYITYDLDWIAASSPQGSSLKEVEPIWMDVVGGFYPVYDPTRQTDGTHERTRSFTMAKNYEIVGMAGHVHPGGLRDEIRVDCVQPGPADGSLVFTSEAKLNPRDGGVPDQRAFGSWDYLMTHTPSDWRLVVKAGDRLDVTAVYDTEHPWYEAMGIVFAWGNPLAPGEEASALYCSPPSTTVGGVTNDVPPQAVFGGETAVAPDPSTRSTTGPPVSDITIAAFDYQPGGLGQPPAPVKPGSRVRFNNWDAAASIFHTVTTCKEPCNRDYGQSYPLAEWGFDSRQLGFGPPGVTAAANTPTFALDIPADAAPDDTFTFFCRVHPFMRGALKVDPDATGTIPQPPIVPSPPSLRSRVSSLGFQYIPSTLSVAPGSYVDYVNADPVPHNVTSEANRPDGQPLFRSDTVTANVGEPATIDGTESLDPGSYKYFCTLHPFMRGVLEVTGSGIPPPGPAPPLPVPSVPGTGSVPTPTSITVRDDSVYAASAGGVVYQLPILPDGSLGQAVPYAAGFVLPLGIVFDEDGTLYVSDSHPSTRAGRQSEGRVSAVDPVSRLPTVVIDGLPNGRHNTNGLAVHDGRLYISNGNSTDDGVDGGSPEEPLSGTLLSVPLNARGLVVGGPDAPLPAGLRVDAVGMRNLYDVAFRPNTDEAWITMNGLDAQDPYGEDLLLKADITDADTEDFGFPGCVYAAGGDVAQNKNPAVTDECDGTQVPPEALLGLHVSANGFAFAPDGSLYIALFGNNPGEISAGHQVIRVPISADGVVSGPQEVIVDGGSPLDVAFGPAGLYVADFSANTITLVPH